MSQILTEKGYIFKQVSLSNDFGVVDLYGFDALQNHLFEVELTGRFQATGMIEDIEAALLDPPDSSARWHHYQACATQLGRVVHDFHDDPAVDELYRITPMDLGVVELLRSIADGISDRPVIFNLDPDFTLRFGRYVRLNGLDAIRKGVWQYTVFTDLETPLQLVIT
jgi:hypothetical protein